MSMHSCIAYTHAFKSLPSPAYRYSKVLRVCVVWLVCCVALREAGGVGEVLMERQNLRLISCKYARGSPQ